MIASRAQQKREHRARSVHSMCTRLVFQHTSGEEHAWYLQAQLVPGTVLITRQSADKSASQRRPQTMQPQGSNASGDGEKSSMTAHAHPKCIHSQQNWLCC